MQKKILLTGATGFIGRHLLESWKDRDYRILAIATNTAPIIHLVNDNVQLKDLDIVDEINMAILFEKYRPDVVIHTAGMSKPNECETDKESAFETNVLATKNIAECSKKHNSHFIFLSTDMVFNHRFPSKETDDYTPVNYYGETKALAEKEIIKSGCFFTILRIIFVYGKQLEAQRNTFLHWVKDSLHSEKQIFAYTDQQRNLLLVDDLCKTINFIITNKQEGIYHLAGEEVFTPYSLAIAVAEYLQLNKKLIVGVTDKERPEVAKRANIAELNTEKARQELGFVSTGFQETLKEIF